jgi:hypothetical protein
MALFFKDGNLLLTRFRKKIEALSPDKVPTYDSGKTRRDLTSRGRFSPPNILRAA